MNDKIETPFPEICKAIQQRRALYYVLNHQQAFVEETLKKGQIEQKEANFILGILNAKVQKINLQEPEIVSYNFNFRNSSTKEDLFKNIDYLEVCSHRTKSTSSCPARM